MNGLLIVSFGTSYQDAHERDIRPLQNTVAAAFPGFRVYKAYGSGMVIAKLKKRDGILLDTVAEALEKMASDGCTDIVVQPVYMLAGVEYDRMVEAVQAAAGRFASVRIGKTLLGGAQDEALLRELAAESPFRGEGDTVVLMGHGTNHAANAVYPALGALCEDWHSPAVLIATVEGTPDFDWICAQLAQRNARRVYLVPLLLAAGDHAKNDMAGEEPDSWKSVLTTHGYTVECCLQGLGARHLVQQFFAESAKNAE